jgi:DNA-binding transcriptional MocR family regulator
VVRDVHASVERVGVGLYTGDPFYATPPKRTGILLGFAPLMRADIREGIPGARAGTMAATASSSP